MPKGEVFPHNGRLLRDNGDGTVTDMGPATIGAPKQPDPTRDLQVPKTTADINSTVVNTADVGADNRRADLGQAAELYKQGLRIGANGQIEVIPNWQPPPGAVGGEENKQAQKNANLDALVKQINRVQDLYNQGLRDEPYSILSSLGDYLPTSENRQFDAAAAGLAEQGLAAFRVPGVGAQSDTELRQFVAANKPDTSNFDSEIEEKLLQLRNRVDATRASLGLPPAAWTGLPEKTKDDDEPAPPAVGAGPSGTPWDQVYGGSEAPVTGGGFGANSKNMPFSEATTKKYNEYFANAIANGGYLDPADFARVYADLGRQSAPPGSDISPDTAAYEAFARAYNEQLKAVRAQTGGKGGTVPPPGGLDVPMSTWEKVRHNTALGASPVIGATNAVTLGAVEGLAPDEMAALREHDNPYVRYGELGGEVAGTIYGTNKIGKFGTAITKKALNPRLAARVLRGGGKAKFARNLATDATYGAGYGTVTEGDPLKGAAIAGVASTGGQTLGKVGAGLIGGKQISEAAMRLKKLGVPLTVGQSMGGFAKNVEDMFVGTPFVGMPAGARRVEGLQAALRAAGEEAGAPIGASSKSTGLKLIDDLNTAKTGAYTKATAGKAGPLDNAFISDITKLGAVRDQLLPDQQLVFNKLMTNRVVPLIKSGKMTGDDFQQIMREFKSARASPPTKSFEEQWRKATTGVMDAIEGQMSRIGGPQVAKDLSAANLSNRQINTLKKAMLAEKGGSKSGQNYLPTGSALQNAGWQNQLKYGGERPFAQLADDMQEVLPNRVPDSGTARRIAQYALPGVVGAAGADYVSDNPMVNTGSDAAKATLATGALLAALGTRRGQKAVNALLTERPDAVRKFATSMGKRKGLLGSAFIPLLIANNAK